MKEIISYFACKDEYFLYKYYSFKTKPEYLALLFSLLTATCVLFLEHFLDKFTHILWAEYIAKLLRNCQAFSTCELKVYFVSRLEQYKLM